MSPSKISNHVTYVTYKVSEGLYPWYQHSKVPIKYEMLKISVTWMGITDFAKGETYVYDMLKRFNLWNILEVY